MIHLRVLLPVLLKQEQVRERKVEQDQDHADPEPACRHSRQVPARLLRNIAGVDDQELREIEIRPYHYEREAQLTDIVKMAFAEHATHR